MKIPVQCRCGKQFSAKPELAGTQVACPACGGSLRIPAVQPASALPPAGINVACVCGSQFRAAPHLYGKRVACPACGGPLAIPSPADELEPLGADPLSAVPSASAPRAATPLRPIQATRSRSRALPIEPRYLIIAGVAVVLLAVVLPLGWMLVKAGMKLVARGDQPPASSRTAETRA